MDAAMDGWWCFVGRVPESEVVLLSCTGVWYRTIAAKRAVSYGRCCKLRAPSPRVLYSKCCIQKGSCRAVLMPDVQ